MKSRELYGGIFSRHAAAYRERHRQIRSEGRERALELLAVRPGELAADLACGPGNMTRRLLAAGARAIAVDAAPGMLALARADAAGAAFARMDLAALGLRSGAFDAVLCCHGLQFLPDPIAALAEARRLLRPGGRLAASVPAMARRGAVAELVRPIADRWLEPAPVPVDAGDRGRVTDPEALRAAAREAGFGRARAERVAAMARFADAAAYVALSTSWWDIAVRLEGLPPERVRGYESELRDALEARFGGGEILVPAADTVLYALA